MIQELNAEEYNAKKIDTVNTLHALRGCSSLWIAVDRLDGLAGGNRLRAYIEGCINDPGGHNLYELLAVARFAGMLSKYMFFPEMPARVIRFFEGLPQPSASGRVYVTLSPAQVFLFSNIYGFYTQQGKRLIREVLLFVPRKFGKTTIAAGMAFYDVLFGDADAEAYITANSLDQSRICFNMVRKIVKLLNKSKVFREIDGTVEYRGAGREGKICSLADNPRTLDGLKASLNVNDESSQAVSYDTKNTVTTSMGTRKNPLTVDITTASDLVEGPFVDQLNNFKAILRGEEVNDTVFAHIFQPDIGDAEDDPQTWRKVNPHIGVTIDVDFYAAEYKKALRSFESMAVFRTKLLNVFVCGSARSWITSNEIWSRFRDFDIEECDVTKKMLYATCSFDLSVRDDFSAVTYIIWLPEEKTMHSHTDYYLPRATIERHSNSELYRKWIEQGHLIVTDGDIVDYTRIAGDILRRGNQVALTAIGYDSYKNAEVVTSLRNGGASKVLKAVPQVRSAFTSPTDIMEVAISRKKITFSPNPITAWCFQNAVVDEDNNGNRKPMKRYKDSPMKIDGAITNLMCLKLWSDLNLQML